MYNDIIKRQRNQYQRRGIMMDAHLRREFPNKYKDYTEPSLLKSAGLERGARDIAVLSTIREATVKKAASGVEMLVIKASDREGTPFTVRFIRMTRLRSLFEAYIGSEILLMGAFQFDPIYGYSVFNPEFTQDIAKAIRYKPVYSSIKDISEKSHEKHIAEALKEQEAETLPEEIRLGYPEINAALKSIHFPKGAEDALRGQARVILDDIIYFKLRLLHEQTGGFSRFIFRSRSFLDSQIKRFPYELTGDQLAAVNGILEQANDGQKICALVQGDVGSGKTAVAFCLMFCAAENGMLSVLMAPTQILARQHYQELIKYVNEKEAGLLDGTLQGKERKALEKRIDSGEIKYVIGTSAIITSGFDKDKVGLVIIDEEHRFGVWQREGFYGPDSHIVTMSATPIPRTLAQAVYGDRTAIYQIREKPAGRLPVITYYDNGCKVLKFVYARLKEGGRAYVICAMKESADENSPMGNVASAEETFLRYKEVFEPLGFPVCIATGNSSQQEKEKAISDFADGRARILVATTVVEVGVNVPEANVVVVQNAERFGLSTLHQLRGRVGRGNSQAYCILVSKSPNERIRAMCMTNDGFAIAEEDLRQRKSGDLLGLRQSGKEKFIEEIIAYPDIADDAAKIVQNMGFQAALRHLEKYRNIYCTENNGHTGRRN